VIANGDILDYEDGKLKMIHPENQKNTASPIFKNLDGFMIGRASFGNPWCFLPNHFTPTL